MNAMTTEAYEAHKPGKVLYEKNTGKPYKIIRGGQANGLTHYRLACEETGKSLFLSNSGIFCRFNNAPIDGTTIGTLVLTRLTKLL